MTPTPPSTSPLRQAMPGAGGEWEAECRRSLTAGQLAEAEDLARQRLLREPNDFAAHYLLGEIELRRSQPGRALAQFRRCSRLDPAHVGTLAYLGRLLMEQGQKSQALSCFRRILQLEERDPSWHYIIAQYFWDLGRRDEALAAYRRVLALRPEALEIASELGERLLAASHFTEAERFNLALAVQAPGLVAPHLNLGRLYRLQEKAEQARGAFAAVLLQVPEHAEALTGLAWALIAGNQADQAEQLLTRVLSRPGAQDPDALQLAARLRDDQGKAAEAIRLMTLAIAAGAENLNNYLQLASWQDASHDPLAAIATLEAGIRHHGDQDPALQVLLFFLRQSLCDWRDYPQQWPRVLALLTGPAPPRHSIFSALQMPGLSSLDLRRLTRLCGAALYDAWARRPLPPAAWLPVAGRRLRIGYLSADFHQHATAFLTAAVFEHHDRRHFEVFAYSYGPDDGSSTRRRLEAAFEHFVDISDLAHVAAAERIRADGIDILIDLKGYTRHARPEIVAQRPAPLQVNWLGYPGTLAADFMDYIIVDPTLVAPGEAPAYQEALAYLPHAYAPLDLKRAIAPRPSRAEAGLPETGLVLCCFNDSRKITPEFFHCWCRLLVALPEAVLWLFAKHPAIIENLRREATQAGLEPHRIIPAPYLPQAEHLARLPLADLVLDTLPYNAHTTSSDALMMGVPVLTCRGETFPGRVAASLCRAAGVPELVTESLEEYERLALALAADPGKRLALRQRLVEARANQPYFDTAGFTAYLEDLYRRMWDRLEQGLPPALLAPADLGTR